MTGPVEELLRELAPRVLGVLVRRHGAFDACEDALQEALLAAATPPRPSASPGACTPTYPATVRSRACWPSCCSQTPPRPARTRPDGALIPLAEQDRGLWDTAAITEGVDLITTTLATAAPGPYQVQAAIAAVHDEATGAEGTDWPQILGLCELLACLAPGPMEPLNRIVAVGMVRGPAVALAQLDAAETDPALTGHHRVDAVRAQLLDEAGQHDAAREHYRRAARHTLSLPEQRCLLTRATTP